MIPIQSSSSGNGALDEFYDRQAQVLKHLGEVSAFTEGGVPVMLDALIDCTKKDLKKIKKKETKLNTQNAEQTAQLLQLSSNRDTLVSDLKETANSNHTLME